MKDKTIFRIKLLAIALLLLFNSQGNAQFFSGRTEIHSHNDYLHNEPLLGALKAHAKSIETDVFLVGDELYVAHTKILLSYKFKSD